MAATYKNLKLSTAATYTTMQMCFFHGKGFVLGIGFVLVFSCEGV